MAVLDEPKTKTKTQPRRSQSGRRSILYFDLETIPDYERMDLFDLEPIPDPAKRGEFERMPHPNDLIKQTLDKVKEDLRHCNPEDKYLDALDAAEKATQKPRKGLLDVTAELRRQDAARDEAIEKRRKLMSVTPEFNKIVALGWSCGGDEPQSMVAGDYDPLNDVTIDEIAILNTFWLLAESHKQACGFNVLGFDLPTIFVRSILLGVKPSRQFDTKPWGEDVIDLMAKRFPKSGSMRLKLLAKVMGLNVLAEDVDGSQVEELLKNDPLLVGRYVRSDVQICVDLHDLYAGLFC